MNTKLKMFKSKTMLLSLGLLISGAHMHAEPPKATATPSIPQNAAMVQGNQIVEFLTKWADPKTVELWKKEWKLQQVAPHKSIFISKKNPDAVAENVFNGDNNLAEEHDKAKNPGITPYVLGWDNNLRQVRDFLRKNAPDSKALSTAWNSCVEANNAIKLFLKATNENASKPNKFELAQAQIPTLSQWLAELEQQRKNVKGTWFFYNETQVSQKVTLAALDIMIDALKHIINTDFAKLPKTQAPSTRPGPAGGVHVMPQNEQPKALRPTPVIQPKPLADETPFEKHFREFHEKSKQKQTTIQYKN